jgi:hypothetical protein
VLADEEFPGWHLFRSRPEPGRLARFWATRTGKLRRKPQDLPPDESARWAMTVDGDSEGELWLAIKEQEALDDTG